MERLLKTTEAGVLCIRERPDSRVNIRKYLTVSVRIRFGSLLLHADGKSTSTKPLAQQRKQPLMTQLMLVKLQCVSFDGNDNEATHPSLSPAVDFALSLSRFDSSSHITAVISRAERREGM
ncbi:hypothetical protein DPX16_3254 [Anabarilius grahami]|uniref:Uncharacterized protein n=1 Tax=Anabarilius grahami TaxID=495550 RepID=A0A3N0YZ33_ANAGA|nr:hypothetical protein DPX16_3254 [Anabarilius grahami]